MAMRHIHIVVPVPLNKIDRLVAGVIAVAVFIPALGMAGRHMEVNRLLLNSDGRWHGQNRILVNQLWHGIVAAQIDLSIKAGLTDIDRYSEIIGQYRDRSD